MITRKKHNILHFFSVKEERRTREYEVTLAKKQCRLDITSLVLACWYLSSTGSLMIDRTFHKCNKFGVDCYCTNVIVYV